MIEAERPRGEPGMNAAVLMGPGRIELVEVPRPPCPEGGLPIKVAACGVCGSDIRAYHGRKQITVGHAIEGGPLPGHIIGHEIAGRVEAVGPGVTGFRRNDLVTVAPSVTCGTCDVCRRGHSAVCRNNEALGCQHPSGFAQYVAVPARLLADGSVNRVPDDVPAWKACVTEPLACAPHAQEAMGIGPGDSVLVLGAGGRRDRHQGTTGSTFREDDRRFHVRGQRRSRTPPRGPDSHPDRCVRIFRERRGIDCIAKAE